MVHGAAIGSGTWTAWRVLDGRHTAAVRVARCPRAAGPVTMDRAVLTSSESLDVLARFNQAPPELVAARSLQQRVDRKFLLSAALLQPLLVQLRREYFVLRAGRHVRARYENLYFDTPERQFYDDHRRGRRPRHKVRIRHHVDRQLTFLEVKRKESGGRTTKARLELPFMQASLGAAECRFIEAHASIEASRLVQSVSIAFLRVTVINPHVDERLTLDCNLQFGDEQRRERLPGVVIAEIKQPRHSNSNGAVAILRTLHAREQALSKYCLATARLAPVRTNTFRPVLRAVARLSA